MSYVSYNLMAFKSWQRISEKDNNFFFESIRICLFHQIKSVSNFLPLTLLYSKPMVIKSCFGVSIFCSALPYESSNKCLVRCFSVLARQKSYIILHMNVFAKSRETT